MGLQACAPTPPCLALTLTVANWMQISPDVTHFDQLLEDLCLTWEFQVLQEHYVCPTNVYVSLNIYYASFCIVLSLVSLFLVAMYYPRSDPWPWFQYCLLHQVNLRIGNIVSKQNNLCIDGPPWVVV